MSPKKQAAEYAFESVKNLLDKNFVLGIGTGSTTNYFIELLKEKKPEIKKYLRSIYFLLVIIALLGSILVLFL